MSDIKSCFPSRWKGGVVLEADFSQLEVVGAAALSEDPTLIADLLSGRDMHRFFAAQLFLKPEEDVSKGERTWTKRMTFQLQYGAGARSMSKKLGIAKEKAEQFIFTYYDRYAILAAWQDTIMDAVKRSRKASTGHTASGLPQGRGEYRSPTGRLYVFLEKDKPPGWQGRDLEPDFNPPEIKNYPIQGFATGDVMAVFRGLVFREWLRKDWRDEALPNNTVHDSIMFDCRTKEVGLKVGEMLERIAREDLPAAIERMWGIKPWVPFKIEVSIGKNWATTTKI
jgi:DNA polymerase-1